MDVTVVGVHDVLRSEEFKVVLVELDAVVTKNLAQLLFRDRLLAVLILGELLDHRFDRLTAVHFTLLLDVVHHIVVVLLESLFVQVVHKFVDMCRRN